MVFIKTQVVRLFVVEDIYICIILGNENQMRLHMLLINVNFRM